VGQRPVRHPAWLAWRRVPREVLGCSGTDGPSTGSVVDRSVWVLIVAGPVGREHGAAPLTGPPARGPICDKSCAILSVDLFQPVISDACHALIVIVDTIRSYSCNDSLEGTVASAATSSGSETAGMRARRPSPTDSNGTDCLRSSDVHDLALRALTPSQALKDARATILAGSRSSLAELFRVLVYTLQAPLPVHP
jgi:hypothetical protein